MPQTKEEVRYNVHCVECGSIWQPLFKSPLWWQAHQRAEREGYLDALQVNGEKCGCKKPVREPNAPFRVFGYDFECRDYDFPYPTFVGAVKAFISANRSGDTVFIHGVSDKVQQELAIMF